MTIDYESDEDAAMYQPPNRTDTKKRKCTYNSCWTGGGWDEERAFGAKGENGMRGVFSGFAVLTVLD